MTQRKERTGLSQEPNIFLNEIAFIFTISDRYGYYCAVFQFLMCYQLHVPAALSPGKKCGILYRCTVHSEVYLIFHTPTNALIYIYIYIYIYIISEA